ncbi:hypothetical protein INS49_003957 [Diaporthe citri]|uniref:uncharacterized protein n=1 Tax=Diaporthe citri TaxID=83186 RepID=UPI001C826232|nr:uncharacterized protein INS49_003957 [Diaporthe citri]KAG6354876.1 hypothetical protein INS49_003957 [Diaporthe citri]
MRDRGTSGSGKKCGFCAKEISAQHQCRSCDFSLCSHCLVNASIVHPGHTFDDFAVMVQASSALCDACNSELGDERYECRFHPAQHALIRRPELAYENGRIIQEILEGSEIDDSDANDCHEGGLVSYDAAAVLQDRPVPTDADLVPRRQQQRQEQGIRPQVKITLAIEGQVKAEEIAKGLMQTAQQLLRHKQGQGTIEGTWTNAVSGRALDWRDGPSRDGIGAGERSGDGDHASNVESSNPLNDFELPDASSSDESELSIEPTPVSSRRRWLPDDRKQLRKMKKQGWSNTRIAGALGRSPGAISQQWNKEKERRAVRDIISL